MTVLRAVGTCDGDDLVVTSIATLGRESDLCQGGLVGAQGTSSVGGGEQGRDGSEPPPAVSGPRKDPLARGQDEMQRSPSARYAYLGPEGAFTETALRQLPAAARADLLPFPTIDAALDAVRSADADAAMVPIENSIEGGVSATVDALATGEPLVVVREVRVPVSLVLAVRPGTTLHDVTRVSTHPHALAQCRGWLGVHLRR